jgi:hypothetical protein
LIEKKVFAQSVQSIIGATDIRRSITWTGFPGKPAEFPIGIVILYHALRDLRYQGGREGVGRDHRAAGR